MVNKFNTIIVMDVYCFKDVCDIYYFNIVLFISFVIIPLSILLVPPIMKCRKENDKNCFFKFIKRHLPEYIFWIMFILIMSIVIQIMSSIFNNGQWGIRGTTCLSDDMGDWGDFATCLTTVFTLISIFYAYRAFRTMEKSFMIANDTLKSQTLAAKRASFDATFTQIFAQHKVLYDKAVNHKIYLGFWNKHICNITNRSRNVFSACREEYEIRQSSMSVKEFWEYFNCKIELEASIDFKNYFKYIYHEVSIVIKQPDDILDSETKLRYIQLIQAQMNYDELICYLINQIEYIYRCKNKLNDNKDELKKKINQEYFDEATWYANNLREYKFFRELCKNGCGYSGYISMLMKNEKEIIEELIFTDWICTDGADCCNL